MKDQIGTVTISKEEFLRYYNIERILHGKDMTKEVIVFFTENYNAEILVINPSELTRILKKRQDELESENNDLQSKLAPFTKPRSEGSISIELGKIYHTPENQMNRIRNKWWFKLFADKNEFI